MANQKNTDFTLPSNAYTTFDAVSIKSLIKQRLNANSTFTGQNFEGSNLSSVIDIIAYSYHVLLFYLNQTSTESLFSESELYENMNRIVKMIDYKPVGYQTCTLPFEARSSSRLSRNIYTIPRYSFFDIGGTFYTFPSDVTFNKLVEGEEILSDLSNTNLVYQGIFREYPIIIATGEEFETTTLLPGDDIFIDYFNIHVYVKSITTGKWEQWNRATSLFLENSTARKYEIRINEFKRVEIKFGNDINGKKLTDGESIAVYYLQSDGKAGEIGPGAIDRSILIPFNPVQFVEIFNQVKDTNINYLTSEQQASLTFTNSVPSSLFSEGETVEDIRSRAPKVFASQYRLINKADYKNYIQQSFSNIIRHIEVVSNDEYINGHLSYNLNTLNRSGINNDVRTLYNQVLFSDSCDFNNIYIYAVPKIEQISSTISRTNYLSPSQKAAITISLDEVKTITSEVVVLDPVYVSVDIGVFNSVDEEISTSIVPVTKLQIVRDTSSTRSLDSIQNAANSIIGNYFKKFNDTFINVTQIANDIMNIEGVDKIYTVRTDINIRTEGINFIIWNPIFPENDIVSTGTNIPIPYYKYPYLNDPITFLNKIEVIPGKPSSRS